MSKDAQAVRDIQALTVVRIFKKIKVENNRVDDMQSTAKLQLGFFEANDNVDNKRHTFNSQTKKPVYFSGANVVKLPIKNDCESYL